MSSYQKSPSENASSRCNELNSLKLHTFTLNAFNQANNQLWISASNDDDDGADGDDSKGKWL